MKSHLTKRFRRLFDALPKEVQGRARESYRLWKRDPYHPGLQFKKVHSRRPIYAVRVGIGWRALGVLEEGSVVWFWIGPHGEYDALLKRL